MKKIIYSLTALGTLLLASCASAPPAEPNTCPAPDVTAFHAKQDSCMPPPRKLLEPGNTSLRVSQIGG